MGFGWALFMPVLNTIIFSVIFVRLEPIKTPVAYPLYAFCGLTAWNFFASVLRFAVNSLTSNPNLVTKVYFPREIFPFAAVLVGLVDFGVASLLLIPLMCYYGAAPSWTIVLCVLMFATCVVYPLDRIGGWAGWLLELNPLTPILDSYRALLFLGQYP